MKAEPAAPAPAERKPPSKGKKVLILANVALLVLLAAYGIGRLQGEGGVRRADERAKAAAEKSAQSVKDLAAEQAHVEQLEARRHLHLCLIAIDDRNFGIAQRELAAAAKLLVKSAPKDGELAKLAAEIAGERLAATEDLAVPRNKLLGWVRRFDQALPPQAP